MQETKFLRRHIAVIGAVIVAVVVIGLIAAFEPVTRTVVAQQFVCFGCHQATEYDPHEFMTPSRVHPATPATPAAGEARCVDCHVPPGWPRSVFVYAHYLIGTDLFGHARDPKAERHGAAVTPIAFKAYNVRDRLSEYDSSPCRTCHIEAEIKPKRKRGQRAHANALENKETCIECHYNLVHREVQLREDTLE